MNNHAIYFPGLNGIRAIAAVAVVISHITLSLNQYGLDPYIFGYIRSPEGIFPRGLDLAGYGVSIFFVLSGFLITYLLQVEKESGNIDVKKFYVRRILRIWPIYFLYMGIALLAIAWFGLAFNFNMLLLYVFFAANIPTVLRTALPLLGHYWSLGVEEQFYIVWPWFNKKMNSLVLLLIGLIVGLVGIKLFLHFFYPHSAWGTLINLTRYHCMMIGALGAVLYKNNNYFFQRITNNKWTQCLAWILFILVIINKMHVASIIDHEIVSILTLILIMGQINVKNRIVNLETKPLNFLGKISYSLYVIHPILIYLFPKILSGITINGPAKYILIYFTIISVSILIAYLAYTYFEKYFLTLKKRYMVVKSSATKNSG